MRLHLLPNARERKRAADTHELLSFERSRYNDPTDGRFTDAEARRFARRGATIIRDSPVGAGE